MYLKNEKQTTSDRIAMHAGRKGHGIASTFLQKLTVMTGVMTNRDKEQIYLTIVKTKSKKKRKQQSIPSSSAIPSCTDRRRSA